ncbi:hypothetical protein TNCV_4334521 [Trichonephila clavipes]|nr:hypothetical protein TNCV_4334521 [Trichonephila clavipes]
MGASSLEFDGERGPCHKHVCHFGSICVVKSGYAICECPTCSEEFEPVCGTDGISYTNVCKLKQEGCDRKSDIDVAYTGLCNMCHECHSKYSSCHLYIRRTENHLERLDVGDVEGDCSPSKIWVKQSKNVQSPA